jgi:putative oxidoreductase
MTTATEVRMGNTQMTAKGWSPEMLSVLRIVAGLLFVQHGSAKLLHAPDQAMFAHLQLLSLLGIQGVIELVGGGLLTVGLFSRPVAFILSGDMAVAFFIAHFPKSWLPILNGGDLAVLFCFTFLYLWAAGPGPWSLDALLFSGKGDGARR